MVRLALGVVLSLCASAWSQTVTEVQVQGTGAPTPGNPGGVNGRSGGQTGPSATLRSPALGATLPGGTHAPKVQTKSSAGGVVAVTVGAPEFPGMEFSAPAVEQRQAASGVDIKKSLEQPRTERPSASGALGAAVRQVQAGGAQEAAGTGGMAVHESLRQVFDAAKKASGEPGVKVLVSGKFQDAEEKISQTVRVANGASPHDAPSLYQAAIDAAKDAFVPGFARGVARAVLASADKKAETSLPQLAQEAYAAAQTGEASAVAKAFKSFGLWDKLLGKDGRPAVENISHLKSDVERVLSEASSGKAPVSFESKSAPRVRFTRAAGASPFAAMLPPSAVSPLPKELAASFVLRETETSGAVQDGVIAAFRREPTASNGARLIFQANKDSGISTFGSVFEAVVYWLKASWANLRHGSPAPSGLALRGGDYEAAMGLVYARGSDWDLRSARALMARGKAMAADYRRQSGDESAEAALTSLEKRLNVGAAKFGVEENDPLPPVLARMVAGDGAAAAHWIERLHELAPAPETQAPLGPSTSGTVAADIERLLSDVKRRGPEAAKTAGLVQSLDPSPLRYATIGRVGDYLIQSAGRRTKGGKLMNFTVLRETASGRLAFARADWAGLSPRPVSPLQIAAP